MCNWAFEILHTSRTSLGLDFRMMLSRFSSHFHGRSCCCIKGSDRTCEGDVLESCQQFTEAETAPESAHAPDRRGACKCIKWSEESYKQVKGARAVSLDRSNAQLCYAQASGCTMAISHVWSHGQGSRPEHGINWCLHRRYTTLARSLSCDSYWIDSTCISSEAWLLKEAINFVFTSSESHLDQRRGSAIS